MKKTTLYSIIFLFTFLTSCKSKYHKAADEIADRIPESNTMNAGKNKYKLFVPDGWSTKHQTYNGVDFYFLNAPQTKADPNTNVNLITENMQHLNLDVFKTGSIKSLKRAIPSAIILDEGDIIANGINGKWYTYTMAPAGVKASLVSYIFPKDGVAYIITAGTQIEDAARYRNTFDQIAKSLKFVE
jgi:hypothetical protein